MVAEGITPSACRAPADPDGQGPELLRLLLVSSLHAKRQDEAVIGAGLEGVALDLQ